MQDTDRSEHDVRVEKVAKLKEQGIEAWPPCIPVGITTKTIISRFDDEQEIVEYSLAGRLMTIRHHGKTIFANLQDQDDRLQLYIRQDVVGEEAFTLFNTMIDMGDIVWVTGTSFKTKTGEITLKVAKFVLLSKCLHPLPEKYHGLADIEVRYRQRYLDLMSNPETKDKFIIRSKLVRELRRYLDDHGYLEVETPMLHPIPGGANARPFVTHHNTYDMDLYLRIAPELYLKRLVVGGFERVYEINRNFRNEGISTKHNPEFTMLEFYTAYQDYEYAMAFVEALIRSAMTEAVGALKVSFGEQTIDFSASFARIPMRSSLIEIGGLSEKEISEKFIDATLKKHKIAVPRQHASYNEKIYILFEELVEGKLIYPTFIIDFPIEVSPLAKRDKDNPTIAARFELFIGGMELANGFNELNDPFDQAERFREQAQAKSEGDVEAMHYDDDYVRALEYGLPPTVGVGVGIDRLTMLVTNTTSIKDVILFPTLKTKNE
ncbi:lysine--tRNA ligase [Candidatus Babeliales bacterium]|nr:lysine--tRNA ligase [Candidatus Babeliales bacterium]